MPVMLDTRDLPGLALIVLPVSVFKDEFECVLADAAPGERSVDRAESEPVRSRMKLLRIVSRVLSFSPRRSNGTGLFEDE